MTTPRPQTLGNRIAPGRFILFFAVLVGAIAVPLAIGLGEWHHAVLGGFDVAAVTFLLSCLPLLRSDAATMRAHAAQNDANRLGLLLITALIGVVILVTVASVLGEGGAPTPPVVVLIVGTLLIAWLFANTVFALHYGHLYYGRKGRGDFGGLEFPGTKEPDYPDLLYFSFTLGMTFQTSDVTVSDRHMRRIVLMQSIASFVFNIGILAFTINALGS